MPMYSFKCTNESCGEEFDAKVSLSEFDTKVVKCPKCDTVSERKIVAQRSAHTTWRNWRL